MYIVNAFWSIVAGNERAAIGALGQLAQDAERNEPDTWMYLIHSPDPGVDSFPPLAPVQVAFVEGFKNRDAYLHHRQAYRPFLQQFGKLFLNMYGPTAVFRVAQAMEMAVGFIRPEAADAKAFRFQARWSKRADVSRDAVKEALIPYVQAVRDNEPLTYMCTASFPDDSPDSPSMPPLQSDQVTFNSSWKDHDAFVAHLNGPVYRDFLEKSGGLFVQAIPGQTTNPYMTTSALKRFAGFFRDEAFTG